MSTCAVPRGAGPALVVGADPTGVLVAGAGVVGDDGVVTRRASREPAAAGQVAVGGGLESRPTDAREPDLTPGVCVLRCDTR